MWYLKFVFNFITQDFPDIHYTEWNILYPEGHIAFKSIIYQFWLNFQRI